MNFKEYINESKENYKKGTEYKITFENDFTFGIYLGTGKGRLSPNKGKDVYIFKAILNQEDYKDGKVRVGFWEVNNGIVKITEVKE